MSMANYYFERDIIEQARRIQQLEINNNYLLRAISEVHDLLIENKIGTWQMMVEQVIEEAKKIHKERISTQQKLRKKNKTKTKKQKL